LPVVKVAVVRQRPDLFRANAGTATVLFDMTAGIGVANVLGVGDPDVHFIDGQWTMFLGGFTTGFAVRIFEARLPTGHELDSDDWRLTTMGGRSRRAAALFNPPRLGAWDSHGTHTPSYVRARPVDGSVLERIYYAGRSTVRNGGPRSRYSIGVAERIGGPWRRYPRPVLVGDGSRRSVFEPLVRYQDGLWKMWFQRAPHEVGRGEQPDYELCYTESADGIGGWSPPKVVFGSDEGYFDNSVQALDGGFEMLLARGSNLYGTSPYPPQGIWWVRAKSATPIRSAWTRDPVPILDAESDPPAWLSRGAFGPDFQYGRRVHDSATLYVFTSGTSAAPPWPRLVLTRLRERRLPPIPVPFALAVGRLTIPNARQSLPAAG
jgi:hypothetical protein